MIHFQCAGCKRTEKRAVNFDLCGRTVFYPDQSNQGIFDLCGRTVFFPDESNQGIFDACDRNRAFPCC